MSEFPGGNSEGGPGRSCTCEVFLLGGFQLCCAGRAAQTTHSCERLVAFLALNDRSLPRSFVAATLWPDTTDSKAAANLRTALWRLQGAGADVVDVGSSHVALHPDVWVDVRYVHETARVHRVSGVVPDRDFIDRARGDLLPGFWDSWLVFERERVRQELIHLYEVICCDALERGDSHHAVLAALTAVECDPLRESSTAWLIKAHRAAGNDADAHMVFRSYSKLLSDELGICPSAALVALATATADRGR